VVLLDQYSTWILRLARSQCCRCIGIVKEKKNLECQFFDLRYSFQTKFQWHGLLPHHIMTEWQPLLYFIFQLYTWGHFHLCKKGH